MNIFKKSLRFTVCMIALKSIITAHASFYDNNLIYLQEEFQLQNNIKDLTKELISTKDTAKKEIIQNHISAVHEKIKKIKKYGIVPCFYGDLNCEDIEIEWQK